MPPAGIVPSFDELEDGHARLGLRPEAVLVEEFAFKGGEEALGLSPGSPLRNSTRPSSKRSTRAGASRRSSSSGVKCPSRSCWARKSRPSLTENRRSGMVLRAAIAGPVVGSMLLYQIGQRRGYARLRDREGFLQQCMLYMWRGLNSPTCGNH